MSTTVLTAKQVGSLTAAASESPARLAVRRFRGRPAAVIAFVVVVFFIFVAVFAPWLAPEDPIKTSWSLIRKAPDWAHWMGTDENGRDVLSRVIFGARASLMAGVISVSIGVPLGVLSAV